MADEIEAKFPLGRIVATQGAIAEIPADEIYLAPTRISEATDNYFGPGLISMRALARSSFFCLAILTFALGLTGIQNGRIIGIAPWNVYRETAVQVDQIFSKKQPPPKTEQERQQQQAMAEIKGIVTRYSSTFWVSAYSAISLMVMVFLNCFLFSISVMYSRMILREIIVARGFFSTVVLLLANFALIFPLWAIVFVLITCLFSPVVWLAIPVVFLLSKSSIYWLFAFLGNGFIAGWAFGNTPVKIITLVGFFPSLLAVVITGLTGIALYKKDTFYSILNWFLGLCVEKGPTKVAAATLTMFAAITTAIMLVIRYWK